MIVDLYDRSKMRVSTSLALRPQRYSALAIGGSENAVLTAQGKVLDDVRKWLGYFVIIRNRYGTPVWWGRVEETNTSFEGLNVGVSLAEVRNRISGLYSYLDGDGYPVPTETAFAEHARSIETYGAFEERHTLGEANTAQALAVRDRVLAAIGLPQQSLGLNPQPMEVATIRCVGLWQTLRQTYYANSIGREVFENPDNAEQVLGWGITANDIGFADKSAQRFAGGLDALREGDKFTVSGSASNNGTFTVFNEATGKPQSYSANTIAFAAGDNITDSAEGLAFIKLGSYIKVEGSAANSRYHLVDETGRGAIATAASVTGAIQSESAGPSVTIRQGQMLEVEGTVNNATPGATVTLTAHGTKVAYSFTVSGTVGWSAGEVWAKLKRVGALGDSVKIELCTDSGGAPGAVLASATVAGSSILQRMGWVQFNLTSVATLTAGATYWIVISRTGTNSATDYYTVGLDEEVGHAGALRLWTGSAWVARTVNASMPFQVWGHSETTVQIREMLIAEGQYFSGVDVRISSGIPRRQWRAGSLSALDEITDLLTAGTNAGSRILPSITHQWRCVVDALPTTPLYILRKNRTLAHISGTPVEEGILPVGQWCNVDGVVSQVDALAPLSPFVIGRLEYNAERGELVDIRSLDAGDIWALGVRQG